MLSRLSRFGLALPRSLSVPPARFVSESKPHGGASSAAVTEVLRPRGPAEDEEVNPYVKNPEYHGFSDDPEQDVLTMRVAFFMGVSVCLVLGGAFIHYLPDHKMQKWYRREAERVLVLREKEGLLLVNPDYYDPSTFVLPASEDQ